MWEKSGGRKKRYALRPGALVVQRRMEVGEEKGENILTERSVKNSSRSAET